MFLSMDIYDLFIYIKSSKLKLNLEDTFLILFWQAPNTSEFLLLLQHYQSIHPKSAHFYLEQKFDAFHRLLRREHRTQMLLKPLYSPYSRFFLYALSHIVWIELHKSTIPIHLKMSK